MSEQQTFVVRYPVRSGIKGTDRFYGENGEGLATCVYRIEDAVEFPRMADAVEVANYYDNIAGKDYERGHVVRVRVVTKLEIVEASKA